MDQKIANTLHDVFILAAPEAALVVTAFVVFLGGVFHANKLLWGLVSLIGLGIAGWLLTQANTDLTKVIPTVSVLYPDSLALYTRVVGLIGAAVLLFASWDELPESQSADYFACLLCLTAGVGLVGAANELITLFLALELISIPTYVMLYLPRVGQPVQEAAVKYFLLSIFSSAFLLFGFSYVYGVTGTTNVAAIHEALARHPLTGLLVAAAVFIIAGLGFRITAVPFHFYAPDVYEGTANGPAALLAFVPKVAGFVALIRLLGYTGPGPVSSAIDVSRQIPLLLWILAAVTMTVGNIMAVWQDNVKRLLAYSGIAHSGYMLMGLAVTPYVLQKNEAGVPAVLFYLLAYGAMTIGAFAVLQAVSTPERPISKSDDLAGLSGNRPGLALLFALFLFSLIGLPLTAGFTGKFLLFLSAFSTQAPDIQFMFRLLALIAAVNAAIGAYYYLRLVGVLYLRTAIKPLTGRPSLAGLLALWACAGVTIWLGVYPDPVARFAREAGRPNYPIEHLVGP